MEEIRIVSCTVRYSFGIVRMNYDADFFFSGFRGNRNKRNIGVLSSFRQNGRSVS